MPMHLTGKGLAAAVSKMAFGNKLGVTIAEDVTAETLFAPGFGNIVAEVKEEFLPIIKEASGVVVGEVNDAQKFVYKEMALSMDEALDAWQGTLERVFPTRATEGREKVQSDVYDTKNVYVCRNKVAKPTVFIPVFPGTNCEYDSAKAFERAGANTIVKVFKNLSATDIRDSVDEFVKAINQSQIIMFPGGFSAGDEPEGSAKFFATAFRNAKMTEAVSRLLSERDGLALGICNGFQALIKLGLVPYGQIQAQSEDSPDADLQHHQPPHQQDGIYQGRNKQIPMAAAGKAWCNILQPGIPWRGTFRSSEGMAGQAFLQTDRLPPSMSMKPASQPWMKSGMSMVRTWRSRVSPVGWTCTRKDGTQRAPR